MTPPGSMWRRAAAACLLAAITTAHAQTPPDAVSADGRWHFAADGAQLVIDDRRSGERVKTLRATALDGSGASTVREIHVAARRRSVVVVFETLAELWEISTDTDAAPVFDGLVHDYRMGEAIALPGFLNPRRTRLEAPLRGLAFDPSHAWVLGRAPDRADGTALVQVWQLDIRRRIGERTLRGDPDTAAARWVERHGTGGFEVPDRASGATVWVDPRRP